MLTIEERFNQAVEIIQNLPKDGPYKPTNEEKLKFYGYFKQATVGKNNTKRPGMLDFVGKLKWDAWSKLGEMPAKEAMMHYVEVYEEMEEKLRNLKLVPQ